MFFPIENLPEETLLGIFECLELKDLGRCLQVSKLFRKIALDETLWQTIKTVDKDVSAEFLVQALTYGTKYLSLKATPSLLFPNQWEFFKRRMNCMIYTLPHSDVDFLEFPKQNQLKSLNLDIGGDKKILKALLDSCQSLEKLYIPKFSRFDVFRANISFSCIATNGQSLRIINFGEIHLGISGVQIICDNCLELTELAVNIGGSEAFTYLCKNLTTKIRKLHITTPRLNADHQAQAQEYFEILSERCNELIALSITGLALTIIGITRIMKNLSQSLEIIRFRPDILPWHHLKLLPLTELLPMCQPMPNLTKILVSGLPMKFHTQIQQLFTKKLPHVKVLLFDSQIPAFLYYCKKYRASVRELYPNFNNRQITKILGEPWGNLTQEEKLQFRDKNENDGIAIPDE